MDLLNAVLYTSWLRAACDALNQIRRRRERRLEDGYYREAGEPLVWPQGLTVMSIAAAILIAILMAGTAMDRIAV